jgi:hypothetical protein
MEELREKKKHTMELGMNINDCNGNWMELWMEILYSC